MAAERASCGAGSLRSNRRRLNARRAGHVDQVDSLDARRRLNSWSDEMTHVRRTTTLALGVLLTVMLAACGSSSSGGSSAVSPGTSPNVAAGPTVTIKDFTFSPGTLNVKVGTTVTFVQEDSVPHNTTGSGAASFIKSPTLSKGQTYTVTFSKAGTYPYICTIHPYMHGTVVVS
jgi:amicyanin